MSLNFPEPPVTRALLVLALTALPAGAWAQNSFFECAKNPASCAPISRPAPASVGGDASEQERIRQQAADLRLREQQAREAREEAERLRLALEEARRARSEPAPLNYRPGRRLALVIGNNRYLRVPRLETALLDAQAMASALRPMGFDVTLQTDLAEKPMKQVLRDFKARVQEGDEVMVFYAGHGVQIGGSNYLLPIDIRGEGEDQVRDDAIPLQRILDDMQDRRAGFTLAVIDACRDNPFRSTGRALGGRGLAPTTATSGQMIIFSAGTGQQALDRLPGEVQAMNGVFTRVFLREIIKPNIPVDRVLRTVRQEVVQLARAAGTEQTPALYDQAVGDFFFRVEHEPDRQPARR